MHPKNISQRQKRGAEFIKRFVTEAILKGEVRNAPFLDITISDVHITPDFKFATVYVVTRTAYSKAKPKNEKNILQSLQSAASHLRHLLAKQMDAKATPRLEFVKDTHQEQAEKISRLISEVTTNIDS